MYTLVFPPVVIRKPVIPLAWKQALSSLALSLALVFPAIAQGQEDQGVQAPLPNTRPEVPPEHVVLEDWSAEEMAQQFNDPNFGINAAPVHLPSPVLNAGDQTEPLAEADTDGGNHAVSDTGAGTGTDANTGLSSPPAPRPATPPTYVSVASAEPLIETTANQAILPPIQPPGEGDLTDGNWVPNPRPDRPPEHISLADGQDQEDAASLQSQSVATIYGSGHFAMVGQPSPEVERRLERLNQVQRTPTVDPGCPERLRQLGVRFTLQPDEVRGYCVVTGAVKVQSFPGVDLRPAESEMTCDMAERAAKWLRRGVQPAAMSTFNQPVTALRHYSAYSCRRRGGGKISEHGFANALDVAVFELANGERFSLEDNWDSDGTAFGNAAARFLREVNRAGCEEFMLVLNPDSDADHYNHFHFDAGPWKSCG